MFHLTKRQAADQPPRREGLMTKWETHLLEATKEPDGVTPSSARIYALWLIAFVLLAQFLIVDCLVWKLLTLDASSPNAIGLANVYASVLRVFMLWSMLFDVATALSLYGINVWKYVAAMRTGQPVRDDEEAPAPVASGPIRPVSRPPVPAPVIPAPAVVTPAPESSEEGEGSRVD